MSAPQNGDRIRDQKTTRPRRISHGAHSKLERFSLRSEQVGAVRLVPAGDELTEQDRGNNDGDYWDGIVHKLTA